MNYDIGFIDNLKNLSSYDMVANTRLLPYFCYMEIFMHSDYESYDL
jgi:hypothetical protein